MSTRLSEYFLRRRPLLWLILAVNFLSALYGFYWYKGQLQGTPLYLWLFTPDCPLAALMMAVALGLFLFWGKRRTWYHTLTYTTLLKYGFWTAFVFSYYWLAGGKDYSFGNWMFFISHIGMLIEGAVFIGSVPPVPSHWWLAAVYSLAFDYFDYFHPVHILGRPAPGVYPWLPNDAQRPLILALTLAVTGCLMVAAAYVTYRARKAHVP